MIAYEQILEILNNHNIKYTIHTHEEIPTVEVAKEKVDFDLNHCMKTIAFEYDDKYIFVSTLANNKLDYSKLCSELKLIRSKLKRANTENIEKNYGFEDGGIGPFSISDDITVVLDNCLKDNDVVYCGSGLRSKTIELKYDDLSNLDKVKTYQISK